MKAAIPFPQFSPEIFTLTLGSFEFALRWYALAYIVGILIGWRLAVMACASKEPHMACVLHEADACVSCTAALSRPVATSASPG